MELIMRRHCFPSAESDTEHETGNLPNWLSPVTHAHTIYITIDGTRRKIDLIKYEKTAHSVSTIVWARSCVLVFVAFRSSLITVDGWIETEHCSNNRHVLTTKSYLPNWIERNTSASAAAAAAAAAFAEKIIK